jgi:hypothetical protein
MDESGKPKYIHQHNSPTSPLQPTRRAGFSSVKLTSPDGTGGRLNGSVGLFAGKTKRENEVKRKDLMVLGTSFKAGRKLLLPTVEL